MEDLFGVRPRVCFEIQKIIDVAVDNGNQRNYSMFKVQWAPSWVSGFHLVGCEHLVEEFTKNSITRNVLTQIRSSQNDPEEDNGSVCTNRPQITDINKQAPLSVNDNNLFGSKKINSQLHTPSIDVVTLNVPPMETDISNDDRYYCDQINPNVEWEGRNVEDIYHSEDTEPVEYISLSFMHNKRPVNNVNGTPNEKHILHLSEDLKSKELSLEHEDVLRIKTEEVEIVEVEVVQDAGVQQIIFNNEKTTTDVLTDAQDSQKDPREGVIGGGTDPQSDTFKETYMVINNSHSFVNQNSDSQLLSSSANNSGTADVKSVKTNVSNEEIYEIDVHGHEETEPTLCVHPYVQDICGSDDTRDGEYISLSFIQNNAPISNTDTTTNVNASTDDPHVKPILHDKGIIISSDELETEEYQDIAFEIKIEETEEAEKFNGCQFSGICNKASMINKSEVSNSQLYTGAGSDMVTTNVIPRETNNFECVEGSVKRVYPGDNTKDEQYISLSFMHNNPVPNKANTKTNLNATIGAIGSFSCSQNMKSLLHSKGPESEHQDDVLEIKIEEVEEGDPEVEQTCLGNVYADNEKLLNSLLKRFECNICHQMFINSNKLSHHFKQCHNVNMFNQFHMFQCKICHRKCKSKAFLIKHELTHRIMDKEYKCDVCDKTFMTKLNLETHLQTHVVEPYKCSFCEKMFLRKGDFTRHTLVHTWEYRFECKICKKRFKENHQLHTHTLEVHGTAIDMT